jgi:hypothetical protein
MFAYVLWVGNVNEFGEPAFVISGWANYDSIFVRNPAYKVRAFCPYFLQPSFKILPILRVTAVNQIIAKFLPFIVNEPAIMMDKKRIDFFQFWIILRHKPGHGRFVIFHVVEAICETTVLWLTYVDVFRVKLRFQKIDPLAGNSLAGT